MGPDAGNDVGHSLTEPEESSKVATNWENAVSGARRAKFAKDSKAWPIVAHIPRQHPIKLTFIC